MIKGETVTVKLLKGEARDPLGAITNEYEEVTVDDVLVAPSDNYDDEFDVNGTGFKTTYDVFFPKTFDKGVHGAIVVIRGSEYRVVGNPQRYIEANVPGKWNLRAKVVGYGE